MVKDTTICEITMLSLVSSLRPKQKTQQCSALLWHFARPESLQLLTCIVQLLPSYNGQRTEKKVFQMQIRRQAPFSTFQFSMLHMEQRLCDSRVDWAIIHAALCGPALLLGHCLGCFQLIASPTKKTAVTIKLIFFSVITSIGHRDGG